MKTLANSKVVIKNALTEIEMQEVEKDFLDKSMPILNIQQVLKMTKNKQMQTA
jgi:hypothetical protein